MKNLPIKNTSNKTYFIAIILSLLILFLVAFYNFNIKNIAFEKTTSIESNTPTSDSISYVSQNFIGSYEDLSKVSIPFKLIGENQSNDTTASISLIDNSTNTVIHSEDITYIDLKSNPTYLFEFDKIPDSYNKNFTLKISYTSEAPHSFVPLYGESPDLTFVIDSTSTQGNIGLTQYYYSDFNFYIFISIAFIAFVLILLISIYILKQQNMKVENIFLFLAIPIYIFFIITMPTFTNHDELYHWFRAYEISEGHLLSDVQDNHALTELPSSVGAIFSTIETTDYRSTIDSLNITHNIEERHNYDMKTVSVYSPVQYLPQAIGIKIADIFTDRTLVFAYAGRFMNMIVSITFIYLAIKLIPFGKKVLALIALFPIAIEGFTSLSPDAITLSVAFLLIAYILNMRLNKNIEQVHKKDYFIILGLSTVLALCKIVYLPIIFLVFILPFKLFKDKKHYFIFNGSLVIISTILNLVWLAIASYYLSLYDSSSSQLSVILSQPLSYLWTLLYTIFTNFDYYLLNMIGLNLGWVDLVKLPAILIYGFITLMLISTFITKKPRKLLPKSLNIWFALISIGVIGLIFTSLFIQWTTVGSHIIEGVQGRYFLPILPLILFLLGNISFQSHKNWNLTKFVLIGAFILNYSVILSITSQFI